MYDNNKDLEQEYDSQKDVIEFQNNNLNPEHYIGTDKIPPTVSAPGNVTPLVVMCFLAFALFLTFGLFLFFSDAEIKSSGLIESPLVNKIITLIIMTAISLFFLFLAFGFLKEAKQYYKEKTVLENEAVDETVEDEISKRTCPKCGESIDIDFPKCPNCKYNFLE